MSTPPDLPQKHHPMMIIAAVAVALFCAVGIAAMMGWLPSSVGGNTSAHLYESLSRFIRENL